MTIRVQRCRFFREIRHRSMIEMPTLKLFRLYRNRKQEVVMVRASSVVKINLRGKCAYVVL